MPFWNFTSERDGAHRWVAMIVRPVHYHFQWSSISSQDHRSVLCQAANQRPCHTRESIVPGELAGKLNVSTPGHAKAVVRFRIASDSWYMLISCWLLSSEKSAYAGQGLYGDCVTHVSYIHACRLVICKYMRLSLSLSLCIYIYMYVYVNMHTHTHLIAR